MGSREGSLSRLQGMQHEGTPVRAPPALPQSLEGAAADHREALLLITEKHACMCPTRALQRDRSAADRHACKCPAPNLCYLVLG